LLPPRILVVDDLPEVCELLDEVLTEAGYRVTTAGHPTAARALLAREAFDLAVIDSIMPGESGESLAAHAAGAGLKVIIMTGHVPFFEADEERPWPRLAKPFRLEQAITLVRDVLNGRSN
jgi:DNA-binding NtrC family response regulator